MFSWLLCVGGVRGLLRICFRCVGREAQECTAKPVWAERGRAKPRPKPDQTKGQRESLAVWVADCLIALPSERHSPLTQLALAGRPVPIVCGFGWLLVLVCLVWCCGLSYIINVLLCLWVCGGPALGRGGVQPSIKPHCLFLARVWVWALPWATKEPTNKATTVSVWLWLLVWAWPRVTASRHLPLVLLLVCLVFVCLGLLNPPP